MLILILYTWISVYCIYQWQAALGTNKNKYTDGVTKYTNPRHVYNKQTEKDNNMNTIFTLVTVALISLMAYGIFSMAALMH